MALASVRITVDGSGYWSAMTTSPSEPGDKGQESTEAGYITDDQLPEELRPQEDPFPDQSNAEQPPGTQGPADDGLSDTESEHSGQISEPTTKIAPPATSPA
ncbi:MAG: hypothetical protein ACR2KG_12360 [Nocardioidaceae bacterium]